MVGISPYLPGSLTWGEVVASMIEVQVFLATEHCTTNVIIYQDGGVNKRRIGFICSRGLRQMWQVPMFLPR